MSIFNATAPSAGGEVKEQETSFGSSAKYIDMMTASAIPTWWVLVGGYHGGVTYIITAAFSDGTGVYNRSTSGSANVTSSDISTITATISGGKLRITNTGTNGTFYGTYKLYYIE